EPAARRVEAQARELRTAVIPGRAALAGAGKRPFVQVGRIAGEDEGAALRIDAHEPVAEASPVVDAAAILAEHQATARVDREVVGMIAVDRSLAGEERHELVGGRVEGPERAG